MSTNPWWQALGMVLFIIAFALCFAGLFQVDKKRDRS